LILGEITWKSSEPYICICLPPKVVIVLMAHQRGE
jgi:hypothetical protein